MLTEDYSVSSSDGFDTKSYDEGGWDGTSNVHHSRLYYNKSCKSQIEMHGVEVIDGSIQK